MAGIVTRNIGEPTETRAFDKGQVDIVEIGDAVFGRAVFEPGWSWSGSVKPLVQTESCQFDHRTFVHSGRLLVRLDDGTETELGPGDVAVIPAGHDAWVMGDEPCVMFDFDEASKDYAKPE